MALTNESVTLTFVDYTIEDDGIVIHMSAVDPGPGQDTEYTVFITDAELADAPNDESVMSLIAGKLSRKLRGDNIAFKLDPVIGFTRTI